MKRTTKVLTLILIALITVLTSGKTHAQMRQASDGGFTEGDYEKCINFCKDLDNSEERLVCMRGCANNNGVSTVTLKGMQQAISLVAQLSNKVLKEGENHFYTDTKTGYKYFAISNNKSLVGYQVKTKEGVNVVFRMASVKTNNKCFIIMPDSSWKEVRCPDIIIVGTPVKYTS